MPKVHSVKVDLQNQLYVLIMLGTNGLCNMKDKECKVGCMFAERRKAHVFLTLSEPYQGECCLRVIRQIFKNGITSTTTAAASPPSTTVISP